MIKLVLVRLAEGVLELIVAWRRGGARGVYAVVPAGRGYPGTHKNNRFSRAMMDNGVVCFLWVPASAGMTLTMCGMALTMCGMALMICRNDGGYAGASPLRRPSGFRLSPE